MPRRSSSAARRKYRKRNCAEFPCRARCDSLPDEIARRKDLSRRILDGANARCPSRRSREIPPAAPRTWSPWLFQIFSCSGSPREQRRARLDIQFRRAIFPALGALHLPAQRVREPLHAVANSQHRHAQLPARSRSHCGASCVVHRTRPARKHDARRFQLREFARAAPCTAESPKTPAARGCAARSAACTARRNPAPQSRVSCSPFPRASSPPLPLPWTWPSP